MVMTVLLKIDTWLAKISEVLLLVLGIPFFAALMVEVLMRKLANHSLFGVYELDGYIAIWISMLGAYLAYRKMELARLTSLINKLSLHWRHRVQVLNRMLILIALLILGISGILFILSPAVATQKSVSFGIPIIYAYLGIPVGIFLMAYETFLRVLIKDRDKLDEEMEGIE